MVLMIVFARVVIYAIVVGSGCPLLRGVWECFCWRMNRSHDKRTVYNGIWDGRSWAFFFCFFHLKMVVWNWGKRDHLTSQNGNMALFRQHPTPLICLHLCWVSDALQGAWVSCPSSSTFYVCLEWLYVSASSFPVTLLCFFSFLRYIQPQHLYIPCLATSLVSRRNEQILPALVSSSLLCELSDVGNGASVELCTTYEDMGVGVLQADSFKLPVALLSLV